MVVRAPAQLRWLSGRRETIFTEAPAGVARQRCWVMAIVVLPRRVTVLPGRP